MKYKEFIEDNFLIDEPKTGALVPFKFNKVQERYYETLCQTYSEKDRFSRLREIILKARREGFTSLILAIFATEVILSKHPIRFLEISYKDDATAQHFKRFKTYIESYFFNHLGAKDSREFLETDTKNHEIVMKHNGASFYVGTASARTGERGGTVQGILFSEIAHYPDTENMTARETVEASMRMVDIQAGKIFCETTANGYGNYFQQMWSEAEAGRSRFNTRFFSWKDFYTPEEFKLIASEFTDKSMLKQEYPETSQEAFIYSGTPFFDMEALARLRSEVRSPVLKGNLVGHRPVELQNV